jgi:hypothetical protein
MSVAQGPEEFETGLQHDHGEHSIIITLVSQY